MNDKEQKSKWGHSWQIVYLWYELVMARPLRMQYEGRKRLREKLKKDKNLSEIIKKIEADLS